jgi:N-acetylhexosamine 1-kinase
MVRSLVNVAGESEGDLEKIEVDLEVFKAAARGFLSSARDIAQREIELMVDAPQIMALELGVRFLADYLRGDSYFRLGPGDPSDLNKTRALVQFRLFENLHRNAAPVRRYLEKLTKTR